MYHILFKVPDSWSLDAQQKIDQAKIFKEKGTNYFKQNKFNLAIEMYKKVDSYISYDYEFKDELKTERNTILLATYLNLALCYLKTDENGKAKEFCNKALDISPNNEKALFRRGQANLALASPETALKDFEEVLKIEPKNVAAAKQIALCKNLIKNQLAKEKKLYANMFEKFAREDKQVCKM